MPVNVEDISNILPARNEVDLGPGIRCNGPRLEFDSKRTKARTTTASATTKDIIFVKEGETYCSVYLKIQAFI